MLKKIRKRFEKIESSAIYFRNDSAELKKSKRFECLEIGTRKIEIAITDKISAIETAPDEINYYVFCPYCGKENLAISKTCTGCKHSLESKLADKFNRTTSLLRKCTVCQAMNTKGREFCWVCGKNLLHDAQLNPETKSDNVIILNLDGAEYRSTDTNLPLDVKELMEQIRHQGYKKELIDAWISNKGGKNDDKLEGLKQQIDRTQTEFTRRLVGLIIGGAILLIYIILRISGC